MFVSKIMKEYKHLPINVCYISLKCGPKFALGGAFRYVLLSSSLGVTFYGNHLLNISHLPETLSDV